VYGPLEPEEKEKRSVRARHLGFKRAIVAKTQSPTLALRNREFEGRGFVSNRGIPFMDAVWLKPK
jgi:hypothetical protein